MVGCRVAEASLHAESGELRNLAAQYLDASMAWLLAETPRKPFFQPFAEALPENALAEAFSVIIFGPKAEIRFERQPGAKTGLVRVLSECEDGEEYLGISRRAILWDRNGKLEYREYFTESESGFLRKAASRLADVIGRKI